MAAISGGAGELAESVSGSDGPTNPIVRENQLPGTSDWMLTQTQVDADSRFRSPWIEGYCSCCSLRAGETLRVHVSANPATEVTLDVFRSGYYGGLGGRHVLRLDPFPGVTQADPPIGPNRLRAVDGKRAWSSRSQRIGRVAFTWES